ncbi:hypothetical protein CHUAL_010618 [Chamberlinius hualienensis]
MSGCFECEGLMDLGPPPDLMPPPPIPTFLREPVEFLFNNNGSCNLCGWADGDDVQLVEVIRKYPDIEDVWFIAIVSAAVGAILIAVLVLIAALRCKEEKVKPNHQDTSGTHDKVHNPVSCGSHVQIPTPISNINQNSGPKTLWTSVGDNKKDVNMVIGHPKGNYVLQHHIISQDDLLNCHYEKIDYGSINYPLPPRRQLPPIPQPPKTNFNENGVHFTPKGHAYYANPDSIDGSFDNNGFVDSEVCSASHTPRLNSKKSLHQPDKIKYPYIQSANSGSLDHLIIRDGPEKSSHLHMVTQIHLDGKYEQITSTALV